MPRDHSQGYQFDLVEDMDPFFAQKLAQPDGSHLVGNRHSVESIDFLQGEFLVEVLRKPIAATDGKQYDHRQKNPQRPRQAARTGDRLFDGN